MTPETIENKTPDFDLSCPIPISQYPHVLLAHGGGGKLMHRLIQEMFATGLDTPAAHDGAVFDVKSGQM
ncbi:MAG TPA: hypothetical protein VJZ27_12665, partial [Aggregatilineales bacterium]|nr:hypothetical protein [Aggregatilineales bacterium]